MGLFAFNRARRIKAEQSIEKRPVNLSDLTDEELACYAIENGVDISQSKTRELAIAKIKKALGADYSSAPSVSEA